MDPAAAEAKREAIGRMLDERRAKFLSEQQEKKKKNGLSSAESVRAVISDLEALDAQVGEAVEETANSKEGSVALTARFDAVTHLIRQLEKSLSEQASVLPLFELRRIQDSLAQRKNRFQEVQDVLQPKKKFGFKGKLNKKSAPSEEQSKPNENVSSTSTSRTAEETGIVIKDKMEEKVELSAQDIFQQDVLLSGLKKCHVYIKGSPSTLHLTGLHECTLMCGPVLTSVFMDDCTGCEFALACQQLRIHHTHDSDFYVHVTAKAIVEDCQHVRFAPSALHYDSLEEDYAKSGLNCQINNWEKVDDFNWLAVDKPSPNWSVLPEGERKSFHM